MESCIMLRKNISLRMEERRANGKTSEEYERRVKTWGIFFVWEI